MRGEAENRRSGTRKYTVNLVCPSNSTAFLDCFDASGDFSIYWWGRGTLTIQAPTTCLIRPTLGGHLGDPLDVFYLEGKWAQLVLKNFNIDGGGERTGIYAVMAGKLQLENLQIDNGFGAYGAGLLTSTTTTVIKKSSFTGNAVVATDGGSVLASGGAVFFYAGSPQIGMPSKGRTVTITDTTFQANTAAQGGAIFIEKSSVTGITFKCRKCKFIDNTAGLCAVLGSFKHDERFTEGRPATRLTLDIRGSDFSTNSECAAPRG